MSVTIPLSEAELVGRGTAGDQHALDELVRLHEHRIAALCRSRLRTPEDAADATQETFVRALGRLDQLRDPDAFGPWLRTIAVRVCADHGRERARWSVSELTDDTVDDGPWPEEVVETDDTHQHLRQALHGLGDRDRRALWLRHADEAPVATVAAELGVTEGSARVLLTRARHRLRAAASGLAGVVPAPLREWGRSWLPTLPPWADGLAPLVPIAMAATVAAILVSLPSTGSPSTPPLEGPEPQPVEVVSEAASHDVPTDPVETAPAPSAAPPTPVGGTTFAPEPAPERSRPPVVPDVRIQEGYPEDEDEYLAEIELYDGDDDDSGGGTLRVYSDPVGEPGKAVEEAVDGLLGR